MRKNKHDGSGFEELERTINKTRGGKKKYETKVETTGEAEKEEKTRGE